MRYIRPFWLLLAAFALIAVLLGFNRNLLHLNTTLLGSADQTASALWHVWWPTFAAGTPDGLAINAYNGGPVLANHLRGVAVLQSVPFALINAVSGSPVLALNLVLIASIVATVTITAVYLRRQGAPDAIAALGGLAMATSAAYVAAINGSDVIGASVWVLPLALIAWDAWLARPSMGRAVMVIAVLYAGVLAGVQNFAWILAIWLPYAVWTLRNRDRRDRIGDRVVGLVEEDGQGSALPLRDAKDHIAVMALGFVILCCIYPMPVIVRTLAGFEPSYADPAWTGESRSLIGAMLRSSPVVWGVAALALATSQLRGLGLLRFVGVQYPTPLKRTAILWLVLGFAAFVFGSGLLPDPLRMITGALGLPYQPLYTRTPFLAYSVFALIAFCALAWRDLWDWIDDGLLRVAVIGGMAMVLVSLPVIQLRDVAAEQTTFDPLPAYASIADEPEDYYMLHLPSGFANIPDTSAPIFMGDGAWLSVYGVWHEKRVISGVGYYEQAHLDLYPKDVSAESLGEMINEWRIGYVFVHQDMLGMDLRNSYTRLIDVSEALCPAIEQRGVLIYRARWHPYGCEAGFDE